MQALWTLRTLLGGLSLVAIALSLMTVLQPGLDGSIIAAFAIATMPSLLVLGATILGQKATEAVVPWIWLLAAPWTIVAYIAGMMIGYLANNPLTGFFAIFMQCQFVTTLVSTYDRGRMILLRKVVRTGILIGIVTWVVSSAVFALWVWHQASSTANGHPYCLSEPSINGSGRTIALPPHLDFLLLHRKIAVVATSRIDLHVFEQGSGEAAPTRQYSMSLGAPWFVEVDNAPVPRNCDDVMRR